MSVMGTESSSVNISEPLLQESDHTTVPEWKDQITIRGLLVSAVLGTLFCIITHKLNLTVGIIPSMNVAAGLLGFFFVKTWTTLFSNLGFSTKPFTRQENTVIQTCVVACYGLAFSGIPSNSRHDFPFCFLFLVSFQINWLTNVLIVFCFYLSNLLTVASLLTGGFGSSLIAMDEKTYKLIGTDYPGNRAEDVKNPGLVWMIGFMFVVSFLGLFSLVPLRKVIYVDH